MLQTIIKRHIFSLYGGKILIFTVSAAFHELPNEVGLSRTLNKVVAKGNDESKA